jgi:purine-binding chemotaxis protein CheW
MSNNIAQSSEHPGADSGVASGTTEDFVTMTIENQLFGIPVLLVQDVLRSQQLRRVPLAPREVAGALNLRGRIVTAIDVRRRLRLEDRPEDSLGMSIVVDHGGELYSLIVDSVGEVLTLPAETHESMPATLDPVWKSVCNGVYRLEGKLLLVMDVTRLLDFESKAAA